MTYDRDRIEALLDEGVRDKVYPGAVWAVGDATGVLAQGATGVLDPDEPDVPMRTDTVFDAASLTKILAVWSSIGAFWEDGTLDLDQPLGAFWSEVAGHPLAAVTAQQLLTHTAGVPLRAQLKNLYGTKPGEIRRGVLREQLHRAPGEAVEYTDPAALILGYLAEHLSGQPLDQLATTRTWHPPGHGLHPLRPPARRPRRPLRTDRTRPGHRHPPQGSRPRLLGPPPRRRVRHRRGLHRRR